MLTRPLVTVLLAGAACALAGCANAPPAAPPANLPTEVELLSGAALFDRPVDVGELPQRDLLGLDAEMRAFVATAMASARSDRQRLDHLLRAMAESDLIALDYDAVTTRTARDTFHARAGNCLSFTNLFVALAREAGLEVSYQMVEIPPSWSMDGDLLMLSQHVNARVRGLMLERGRRGDRIVDFNAVEFNGNYRQRVVGDHVARALFHNNLGVTAMQDGAWRSAFLHFRKALEVDPNAPSVWTNLGVLYSRHGERRHAESAFHRALQADGGHLPAMSNLAQYYRQQGDHELADALADRLERHQQGNPYYHYFRAERALQEGQTRAALSAVDRALRMRDDEHQFHFLRARILAQAGRMRAAVVSLEQAREHAAVAALRDGYDRKLGALN